MDNWSKTYDSPLHWSKSLVDKEMDSIIGAIQYYQNKSSPWTKPPRAGSKPWWNKHLERRRKQLRKLGKKVYSLKDQATSEEGQKKEEYKALRRLYQKEIYDAKTTSWTKYIDSIDNNNNMAKFMRVISKKEKAGLRHLRKPEGEFTESLHQLNDLLLDTFCPDSIPAKGEEKEEGMDREVHRDEMMEMFNPKKVKKAIDSFGKNKAPGLDEIRPIALQSLDNMTIKSLNKVQTDLHS